MSNIFKKIGGGLKAIVVAPKNAVTKTVRRKVITTVIASIASILLLYGVELPSDIQDSLAAIIDFIITLF